MPSNLPNPTTWAGCGNAYVELAGRRWSSGAPAVISIEDTEAILDRGEQLESALARLASGQEARELLVGMIGVYESRLRILGAIVNQRRKRYQDDHTGGLDLWLDSAQDPNPDKEEGKKAFPLLGRPMKPIEELTDWSKSPDSRVHWAFDQSHHSHFVGPFNFNQQLEPPIGVNKVVPRPFLNAERLGLCNLVLTYDIGNTGPTLVPGQRSTYTESWTVKCQFIAPAGNTDVFAYKWDSGPQRFYWTVTTNDLGRWLNRNQAALIWDWKASGARSPHPSFKGLDRTTFLQTAKPTLDSAVAERGLESIASQVDKELRRQNKLRADALEQDLARKDDLELFRSVEQLEAARLLLIAYVSMAYPKALASNDRLRSSLFGAEALPGDVELTRSTMNLHDPKLVATIRSQVSKLRDILDEILNAKEPQQRHVLIEETLSRLRWLRRVQQATAITEADR